MNKNEQYIIEQFTNIIMNRDFLAIKENRDYLKILLNNWSDKLRAEEEMIKIQPQLNSVNKIFDELFDSMFHTVDDKFEIDKLNIKKADKSFINKNYGKIEVLHYSFKEKDTNTNFRELAEKENQ